MRGPQGASRCSTVVTLPEEARLSRPRGQPFRVSPSLSIHERACRGLWSRRGCTPFRPSSNLVGRSVCRRPSGGPDRAGAAALGLGVIPQTTRHAGLVITGRRQRGRGEKCIFLEIAGGGLERTLIKDVTKSGRVSGEEGPGFGTEDGCDHGQGAAGGGVDRARPQGAVRKAGALGEDGLPQEGVVPRAQESGFRLKTSPEGRRSRLAGPWTLMLAAAMRL